MAATIQLLVGFFPMIPAMDSDLPTTTGIVFLLAAVLWFGMLLIGEVERKIIWLTFVAVLAYIPTFIDGVAPIAKYTTSQDDPFWNGMYVMTPKVSQHCAGRLSGTARDAPYVSEWNAKGQSLFV
jgi:hypothetical protein